MTMTAFSTPDGGASEAGPFSTDETTSVDELAGRISDEEFASRAASYTATDTSTGNQVMMEAFLRVRDELGMLPEEAQAVTDWKALVAEALEVLGADRTAAENKALRKALWDDVAAYAGTEGGQLVVKQVKAMYKRAGIMDAAGAKEFRPNFLRLVLYYADFCERQAQEEEDEEEQQDV